MRKPNEDYLTGNNSTGQMTLVHETGKMTSLQIAEITGKRHSDVLESIHDPRFGEVWTYPASVLDEVFEQSLTVEGGVL